MVDNPIKGYRNLSQEEIDLINECKQKAIECGQLCDKLDTFTTTIDKRWLAIGRTNLQQGFMAVIRSIAKPETF